MTLANATTRYSIAIGHPTGNQNFRNAALALINSGIAAFIGVGLDTSPLLSTLGPLVPPKLRRELARRSFRELAGPYLKSHPTLELQRLLLHQGWCCRLPSSWRKRFSVDRVYHDFDIWMSRNLSTCTHVYAYEDGAAASFRYAREHDIRRIYDLPIAYWSTQQELLSEEIARHPLWKATVESGAHISNAKKDRKTEELQSAELVVVPSNFVLNSLPAIDNQVRRVARFGSPAALPQDLFAKDQQERRLRAEKNSPLRVLFVGSLGQRKGLADLLQAVAAIKSDQLELIAVGSPLLEAGFYPSVCPTASFHKPRAHPQILQMMRNCDVFCLPSIAEGRALVVQEAMSQGLPVIVTPNTGADDVVDMRKSHQVASLHQRGLHKGKAGFIVPIRDPNAITNAISWCLDNRAELREMGANALDHADYLTWNRYTIELINALRSCMETQ